MSWRRIVLMLVGPVGALVVAAGGYTVGHATAHARIVAKPYVPDSVIAYSARVQALIAFTQAGVPVYHQPQINVIQRHPREYLVNITVLIGNGPGEQFDVCLKRATLQITCLRAFNSSAPSA